MKHLREVKFHKNSDINPLTNAGFHNPEDDIIAVNIQGIYEFFGEERFPKYFSEIYTHELLHKIINDILGNTQRSVVGEEQMVYSLCGWEFPKNIRKEYERQGLKIKR